jgi:predicted dehydrogenase
MQKIVCAIVGYVMSGRLFHLPPLIHHANYQIKYVMTRNEKNQHDLHEQYPDIEIVTDYHTIIEDPKIDLVI